MGPWKVTPPSYRFWFGSGLQDVAVGHVSRMLLLAAISRTLFAGPWIPGYECCCCCWPWLLFARISTLLFVGPGFQDIAAGFVFHTLYAVNLIFVYVVAVVEILDRLFV